MHDIHMENAYHAKRYNPISPLIIKSFSPVNRIYKNIPLPGVLQHFLLDEN